MAALEQMRIVWRGCHSREKLLQTYLWNDTGPARKYTPP